MIKVIQNGGYSKIKFLIKQIIFSIMPNGSPLRPHTNNSDEKPNVSINEASVSTPTGL